ncbi:STAS domain-containing protein [Actinokineospora sp. NBRC 105648]|uniref:STAS domain-containing protein n=1 Tax=Actinokineospora sp. NBRC 105648 TaxID=3032206 RepID=UPI002555AC77|nr:STAS domain-containing protein [Actinokineospora sp. NBRC 105648]
MRVHISLVDTPRIPSQGQVSPPPEPPRIAAPTRRAGRLLRLVISWQRCGSGSELRVQITGDLDAATAPVLSEALIRARRDLRTVQGAVGIMLDLCAVPFLGAGGMHVIANAHNDCAADGLRLRVVAQHLAVTRPLTLTGLDRLLDLRPTPSR